MRVLVTGAAGQVGGDLVPALLAAGHEVHACDLRVPASKAPANLHWHGLDVTDRAALAAVLREVQPDLVYHLAAILSARGEKEIELSYRVNQAGTFNLLEECIALRPSPRVVFASTIAVYGPGLAEPVPEDVHLRPVTLYGITKLLGEMLGEYHHRRFGLDFRCLRLPGLISAHEPGVGTSDYAVWMYVESVRRGEYEAYCRADTRIPLLYMPDAVHALVTLGECERSRLSRCCYNLGGLSPRADEIAAAVQRIRPWTRITFSPDPARQAILDSWPRSLDDSAARRDWGWQPRYDLQALSVDLLRTLTRQAGVNL